MLLPESKEANGGRTTITGDTETVQYQTILPDNSSVD